MKKKYKRAILIFLSLLSLFIGVSIILKTFNENIVFFYSPSELKKLDSANLTKPIRIGGLVKEKSIKKHPDNSYSFILSDLDNEIVVNFKGILPALFKENQGMVAKGKLAKGGYFDAIELLAKHDENYMPKEVADSLKKSGKWRPNTNIIK